MHHHALLDGSSFFFLRKSSLSFRTAPLFSPHRCFPSLPFTLTLTLAYPFCRNRPFPRSAATHHRFARLLPLDPNLSALHSDLHSDHVLVLKLFQADTEDQVGDSRELATCILPLARLLAAIRQSLQQISKLASTESRFTLTSFDLSFPLSKHYAATNRDGLPPGGEVTLLVQVVCAGRLYPAPTATPISSHGALMPDFTPPQQQTSGRPSAEGRRPPPSSSGHQQAYSATALPPVIRDRFLALFPGDQHALELATASGHSLDTGH